MCVTAVYVSGGWEGERREREAISFYRGELPLLDVWKNALQLFVWNKHLINKKHEFAIVILNEKAQWVNDQ